MARSLFDKPKPPVDIYGLSIPTVVPTDSQMTGESNMLGHFAECGSSWSSGMYNGEYNCLERVRSDYLAGTIP